MVVVLASEAELMHSRLVDLLLAVSHLAPISAFVGSHRYRDGLGVGKTVARDVARDLRSRDESRRS